MLITWNIIFEGQNSFTLIRFLPFNLLIQNGRTAERQNAVDSWSLLIAHCCWPLQNMSCHAPQMPCISLDNTVVKRAPEPNSSQEQESPNIWSRPISSSSKPIIQTAHLSPHLCEAQVARTSGLILPALRFACFSPGERVSSDFDDDLFLEVNFDLRRAVMEFVVDVLSTDAASDVD